MAQQDTGLGWSAKEEWLVDGPRSLGEFSSMGWGTEYPHQPLPIIIDPNQVIQNGLHLRYNTNYGRQEDYYIASTEARDIFVCSGGSGSNYNSVYISTTPDAQIIVVIWDRRTQTIATSYNLALSRNTTVGGVTFYYNGEALYNQVISGEYPNVTTQTNVNDIASAAATILVANRISQQINKVNSGYAVACIAKWQTGNGVLITTPILISNESSYTDMECPGSTYNLAKLNIKYDGMMFYMSFFDAVNKTIISTLQEADLSMFKLDLDEVFKLIAQSGMANILITETVDPFDDFPYNEEDEGDINPDPQDDDVDFDDLPTRSFATAGFCRIFNPDVSDLNDLASYMWTDQTFLQTVINHLKQLLENPIEAIISLSMVPVQPPVSSTKVPVNVMFVNTGVSMRPVTNQFASVDCGTTVLQECYGGALDYNPYTRVQVYLPYIGIVQLDTDEVMSKTIHLKYNIDVVTGICCAEIKADNKLLYSFSGHCAVSQPITSADFSSYLNAAVAAAKVAVGVATGMSSTTATAAAAELPPAVPSKPQTSSALVPLQSSGSIGPHLGSPGFSGSRVGMDFSDIPEPSSGGGALWGELLKPGNVNTVASAMGGKMVVQHSGGFSGNSGYLAKRRPYLIVIRPRIANPRNYAQHFGRTSMEYLTLGSCTGYTKVQSVHLSGFDATNPELSEISSLLKGGVLM